MLSFALVHNYRCLINVYLFIPIKALIDVMPVMISRIITTLLNCVESVYKSAVHFVTSFYSIFSACVVNQKSYIKFVNKIY